MTLWACETKSIACGLGFGIVFGHSGSSVTTVQRSSSTRSICRASIHLPGTVKEQLWPPYAREYEENSDWIGDVEDRVGVQRQKVGRTEKTRNLGFLCKRDGSRYAEPGFSTVSHIDLR